MDEQLNETDDKEKTSALDEVELIRRIKLWYKQAKENSASWREEAKTCRNFVAGHQWDDVDIQKLKDEKRPIITFNWIGPMISAIQGVESNQRNEIVFQPRDVTDQMLADGVNSVTNALRDIADIGQEEADAFEDLLITGMGWTDTYMDYETDLDGTFIQEIADCLEMYWDPASKKPNLADRRWAIRAREWTKEDILEKWPDADLSLAVEDTKDIEVLTVENPDTVYKENQEGSIQDNIKKYTVLQCQWYEKKPVYRVQDPLTKQITELEAKEYKEYKPILELGGAQVVKQSKRVYYQAFITGSIVLENKEAPSQKYFTLNCMTGKRDRAKNCWYGVVRPMLDPQRWSNKFFSQILDIINSNAKGGILAEQGAFVDPRKAEEDWAKADSIIWLKEGAIAGGKVQNKPVAQYPQGLDRLMNFALTSLRGVTGINLEFLGQADRQQANVLEQTRKTSAYTTLAKMFESLRTYRRISGLLLIDFMKNYIPVNKLFKILEPKMRPMAQVLKQLDPDMIDIVVSEAPQSENNKAITWAYFMQVLPLLMKMGIPFPPSMLDYSPLPATVTEEWKQLLEPMFAQQQQGGMPPQGQPQGQPPQGMPMQQGMMR